MTDNEMSPALLLVYYFIRNMVIDWHIQAERDFRLALERMSVPGGGRG